MAEQEHFLQITDPMQDGHIQGQPFSEGQHPVLDMPPAVHIQCRFPVFSEDRPHDNTFSRQISISGLYRPELLSGSGIAGDIPDFSGNPVKDRGCLPYQHFHSYGYAVRLQLRQSRQFRHIRNEAFLF